MESSKVAATDQDPPAHRYTDAIVIITHVLQQTVYL